MSPFKFFRRKSEFFCLFLNVYFYNLKKLLSQMSHFHLIPFPVLSCLWWNFTTFLHKKVYICLNIVVVSQHLFLYFGPLVLNIKNNISVNKCVFLLHYYQCIHLSEIFCKKKSPKKKISCFTWMAYNKSLLCKLSPRPEFH